MRTTFVVACILALVAVAVADKTADVGGVQCKVLGQSGKIALGKRGSGALTIAFDSLTEVDSSGNAVGTTGNAAGKHSFNSFANKDFTFTDVVSTSIQGIPAVTFNFTATLLGQAELKVQTYLFKTNGTLILNDEETTVKRGMLKFNTIIKNWPFCTAGGSGNTLCQKGNNEQVGAALDFGLILKSKSAPSRKDPSAGNRPTGACKKKSGTCKKPLKFNLGDGADLGLSTTLSVDGTWQDMETGYPLVEQKGGKVEVVFRFPRFDTEVFYDPTMDSGVDPDDDNDGNAAGVASMSVMAVLCIIASVLLML